MKAITLYQPWATLLVLGIKRYETRSWRTLFRGPIFIHAARKSVEVPEEIRGFMVGRTGTAVEDLPHGAIVGVVNIYNCRPIIMADRREQSMTELLLGDWTSGRWLWLCHSHLVIEPIPCKGRQRIWSIPNELRDRVRAKLKGVA